MLREIMILVITMCLAGVICAALINAKTQAELSACQASQK